MIPALERSLGPESQWPSGLRTLARTCLDGSFPMCLFWGPEDIQIYNAAFAPILGKKHPQAMGEAARATWVEIWDFVGPLFRTVRETKSPVGAENQRLLMERNGYPEETYFTFSYSPVRDENDAVAGILCIVTETTGDVVGERRLRLLSALAAEAAKAQVLSEAYRSLVRAMRDGHPDLPWFAHYEGDPAGPLSLKAASGSVPAGMFPHIAPAGSDPLFDLMRKAMAGETDERQGASGHLVHGRGQGSIVFLRIEPGDPGGQPGCLAIGLNPNRALDAEYRDFLALIATHVRTALANALAYESERRRAESLAELDRAKTAFFSNISHEFRTPLTLLLAPLESAAAQGGLPDGQSERLAMAHRNALRLLKLVNALLDFSRLEAGRIQASYEPLDLGTFTSGLASMFRSVCESAGLALELDCPPMPESAYVDREMWEKIVLNLLSNAYKFTFAGGIQVRVAMGERDFSLSVSDSGIGIPERERTLIFQRFHRVAGARSRTHEGSGIGLSLVHDLVHLHGGEIVVADAPGGGTEFTVRIPRGRAHLPADRIRGPALEPSPSGTAAMFLQEAAHWGTSAPVRPDPARSEATTILVVDDNADMRAYLAQTLGQYWGVRTAGDGQEALESIRKERPHLVLTDVMMPRLDGLGLLRALREDPGTRTLPVVLVSARSGDEAAIEGLDLGADDYLVKPFSPFELVARVRAHVSMALARKDAAQALLESQEQALQSQKLEAIGKLAGGIAHDFNNLLTAVNGYAELVLGMLEDEHPTREFLSEILKAGKMAASLTGQLLSFSRRQIRAPRALDLRVMLEEMRPALIEGMAPSIALEMGIPPGEWIIQADRVQVEQAIMNLVANAAEAMPEGGSITFSISAAELGTRQRGFKLTTSPGTYVALAIQDAGRGMGPEIQAHLFEPFFTTKGQGKGTGMGLATVHAIMKQSGGAIAVESAPGQGTRFLLYFPRGLQPSLPASRAGEAGPDAADKVSATTILVAEDETAVRGYVIATLRREGYRIWEAANGSEAMRILQERMDAVDLLLTDVVMPVMGGKELAEGFLARKPSGRVLFMSGFMEDENLLRGIRDDQASFLPKPFTPGQLSEKVKQVLGAASMSMP